MAFILAVYNADCFFFFFVIPLDGPRDQLGLTESYTVCPCKRKACRTTSGQSSDTKALSLHSFQRRHSLKAVYQLRHHVTRRNEVRGIPVLFPIWSASLAELIGWQTTHFLSPYAKQTCLPANAKGNISAALFTKANRFPRDIATNTPSDWRAPYQGQAGVVLSIIEAYNGKSCRKHAVQVLLR